MADDIIVRSPARPPAVSWRAALPVARLLPGGVAVGLLILWADHNGGYDTDTWYWGALLSLAMVLATVVSRLRTLPLSRTAGLALGLFGSYVAWSYLSITWARAPGVALQGSNRALLYLLLFSLMLLLPWGRGSALMALTLWACAIGVIAAAFIVRLAANDDVGALLVNGRLAAPTGYLNSTAALFTMGALVSIALATQRRLPVPLRGLLLALACADLQLALIVQSRGWLFSLPLVALITIVLLRDRLRVIVFALAPLTGAAVVLHRLLAVYSSTSSTLGSSAEAAGRAGLLVCLVVGVAGLLVAWSDWLARARTLPPRRRWIVGTLVSLLTAGGALGGVVVATHGHPVGFVVRQWNGFSHQERGSSTGSHFGDVGSGRYDFWRVSLDAFLAHPIGGLGQDNFDDYYIVRGRTREEPSWTHSLEMRLLAHTGLVGFALFAGFIAAALRLVLRARRRADPRDRALVAIGLLPLVVWLIHGSVDWFWEMPALSGPALAFLGMTGSIADREIAIGSDAGVVPGASLAASGWSRWQRTAGRRQVPTPGRRGAALGRRPAAPGRHVAALGRRAAAPGQLAALRRRLAAGAGLILVIALSGALGLPYLATRLMSIAADTARADPTAALNDLRRAASLDPVNADPTRAAGEIALHTGRYRLAASQFRETLAREPGDWFAYLGSGLAASALGERGVARQDFTSALKIDRTEEANRLALERVDTRRPLTYAEAIALLAAGK